jgi:hypothetical protein
MRPDGATRENTRTIKIRRWQKRCQYSWRGTRLSQNYRVGDAESVPDALYPRSRSGATAEAHRSHRRHGLRSHCDSRPGRSAGAGALRPLPAGFGGRACAGEGRLRVSRSRAAKRSGSPCHRDDGQYTLDSALDAIRRGATDFLPKPVDPMVGLYGVISYIIAMRRNEIGIRMALGASRLKVVGIILRQTLGLLTIGVALGILLALVATRGAGSLLFGLGPDDPLTLAGAAVFLLAVALMASFVPAHRASRLEPMNALRYE